MAKIVFAKNLTTLADLFIFFDAKIDQYNEEDLPRVREAVEKAAREVDPSTPLKELPGIAGELAKNASVRSVVHWQMRWYVVMVVTIIEAFLRDALAEAASYDPTLMERSEQTLTYTEVATHDSVEAIAASMRDRWARNFVESGGPRKWIEKLERMGAKEYAQDLATTLEEMWGIRHVVVHRAGRLDEDFRKKHPAQANQLNQEVQIDGDTIYKYAMAGIEFVEATSAYLLDRCAANSAPDSSKLF